jgi:hypothetical protein
VDAARNNRAVLSLGLLLIAGGLLFLALQTSDGLALLLMRLWPVFLIFAGAARVACFAIDRRPRSPVDGMILIALGGFFLAIRLSPTLNPLQVYGRYWILLLALFAVVELVRYYSHRPAYGAQPRMFNPWRVTVAALIIITGIAASRAGNDPSLIQSLRLSRLAAAEGLTGSTCQQSSGSGVNHGASDKAARANPPGRSPHEI